MPSATPLRSLGRLDDDGLRLLSDAGLAYADGAEGRLAEIVGGAQDLSSSSLELVQQATDWATTYSLSPVRANLLRSLDLPADARVLEIGCGCGPITRYLGETCALVDSVEPMPARARVARLRTRDLPGVQVHVGTLEDVPREPTYDVVVVVGVLEYVGHGTRDAAPYLDFLRRCHDVLVDGGTLVLAIENALGVKYLAGAGEDHTNRPFDSLEDYLLASPARTFSRRALSALMTQAGLEPTVLGAFPDYKMPRVLTSAALHERSPDLAERLPRFPSPDWVVPRMQLADEAMLWRTLVRAGVGPDFDNSFVVLAGKGAASPGLWPAERLAVMHSLDRRPEFGVRTEVVAADGGLELRRERAHPAAPGAEREGLRHVTGTVERELRGRELLEVAAQEPARRADLLRAWAALVPDEEWMPVDLVPHNVLVADDDGLRVVDEEWSVRGYGRDAVLLRGLLWGAVRLAALTRPERHDPDRTVRELVEEMAGEIGLEVTDELLERFVASESAFLAAVTAELPEEDERRRRAAADLHVVLGQTLVEVRGGLRFDVQWERAVDDLTQAAAMQEDLQEQLDQVRRERAELEAALRETVDRRVRRLGGRVLRRAGLRR